MSLRGNITFAQKRNFLAKDITESSEFCSRTTYLPTNDTLVSDQVSAYSDQVIAFLQQKFDTNVSLSKSFKASVSSADPLDHFRSLLLTNVTNQGLDASQSEEDNAEFLDNVLFKYTKITNTHLPGHALVAERADYLKRLLASCKDDRSEKSEFTAADTTLDFLPSVSTDGAGAETVAVPDDDLPPLELFVGEESPSATPSPTSALTSPSSPRSLKSTPSSTPPKDVLATIAQATPLHDGVRGGYPFPFLYNALPPGVELVGSAVFSWAQGHDTTVLTLGPGSHIRCTVRPNCVWRAYTVSMRITLNELPAEHVPLFCPTAPPLPTVAMTSLSLNTADYCALYLTPEGGLSILGVATAPALRMRPGHTYDVTLVIEHMGGSTRRPLAVTVYINDRTALNFRYQHFPTHFFASTFAVGAASSQDVALLGCFSLHSIFFAEQPVRSEEAVRRITRASTISAWDNAVAAADVQVRRGFTLKPFMADPPPVWRSLFFNCLTGGQPYNNFYLLCTLLLGWAMERVWEENEDNVATIISHAMNNSKIGAAVSPAERDKVMHAWMRAAQTMGALAHQLRRSNAMDNSRRAALAFKQISCLPQGHIGCVPVSFDCMTHDTEIGVSVLLLIHRTSAAKATITVVNTSLNGGTQYHPSLPASADGTPARIVFAVPVFEVPFDVLTAAPTWVAFFMGLPDSEVPNAVYRFYHVLMPLLTGCPWNSCLAAFDALPPAQQRRWADALPSAPTDDLDHGMALIDLTLASFRACLLTSGFAPRAIDVACYLMEATIMDMVASDLRLVPALVRRDVAVVTEAVQHFCNTSAELLSRNLLPASFAAAAMHRARGITQRLAAIPVEDMVPQEWSKMTLADNNASQAAKLNAWPHAHVLVPTEELGQRSVSEEVVNMPPADIFSVPSRARTPAQALRVLRAADQLCQSLACLPSELLTKNSLARHYALQTLINIFTDVLPVPVANSAGKAALQSCIWRTPMAPSMVVDMLELLIRLSCTLTMLAHSFIRLSQHDGKPIYQGILAVVSGAIAVIADALVRVPTTAPAPMCLGVLRDGSFGLRLNNFATFTSTLPMSTPALARLRGLVAQYLVSAAHRRPIFDWNSSNVEPNVTVLEQQLADEGKAVAQEPPRVFTTNTSVSSDFHWPELKSYVDICTLFRTSCTLHSIGQHFHPSSITPRYSTYRDKLQVIVVDTVVFDSANKPDYYPTPASAQAIVNTLHREQTKHLITPPPPPRAETEDDILHLPTLPSFDGALSPADAELLLSYLTAPYIRIPMLLAFLASEDRVHLLKHPVFSEIFERVLLEPGPFSSTTDLVPTVVPCPPQQQGTVCGGLLNELAFSPSTLLRDVCVLLRQAMEQDTGSLLTPVAGVLLRALRTATRVLHFAEWLLAYAKEDETFCPGLPLPLSASRHVELQVGVDALAQLVRVEAVAILQRWAEAVYDNAFLRGSVSRLAAAKDAVEAKAALDALEETLANIGTRSSANAEGESGAPKGYETFNDLMLHDKAEFATVPVFNPPETAGVVGTVPVMQSILKERTNDSKDAATWRSTLGFGLDALVAACKSTTGGEDGRLDMNAGVHALKLVYLYMALALRGERIPMGETGAFAVARMSGLLMMLTTYMSVDDSLAPVAWLHFSATEARESLARWSAHADQLCLDAMMQHAVAISTLVAVPNPDTVNEYMRSTAQTLEQGGVYKRRWARVAGSSNHGRFAQLVDASVGLQEAVKVKGRGADTTVISKASISSATPLDMTATSPRDAAVVMWGSACVEAEADLQYMEVTVGGAHLRPLAANVANGIEIKDVFGSHPPLGAILPGDDKTVRLMGHDMEVLLPEEPLPTDSAVSRIVSDTVLWQNSRYYSTEDLTASERWIAPILENAMQRTSDLDNIDFFLPVQPLAPTAQVAIMLGMSRYNQSTFYELRVWRGRRSVELWSFVHAYGVLQRVLKFTSDFRYTLAEAWSGDAGEDVLPYCATSSFADVSTCKLMRAPTAEGNVSGLSEMYLANRFLQSCLPAALTDSHRYWRDSSGVVRGYPRNVDQCPYLYTITVSLQHSPALGQQGHVATVVRTPVSAELKAVLQRKCKEANAGNLTNTDANNPAVTAEEESLQLIDLQSAPVGTAAYTLATTLARIESLSHVLAWAPAPRHDERTLELVGASGAKGTLQLAAAADAPAPAAEDGELVVTRVELPRLGLVLTAQPVPNGTGYTLAPREHPGLFLSTSPDAHACQLAVDIPNSLLLTSAAGDHALLVAAYKYNSVKAVRKAHLSENSSPVLNTRYFLYPLHASQAFLQPPSLLASMYLFYIHVVFHRYEEAAKLVAAIVSDTPFAGDELALFRWLVALPCSAPDALALILHLLHNTHEEDELSVRIIARLVLRYSALSTHKAVSAACKLPLDVELSLLRDFISPVRYYATVAALKRPVRGFMPLVALAYNRLCWLDATASGLPHARCLPYASPYPATWWSFQPPDVKQLIKWFALHDHELPGSVYVKPSTVKHKGVDRPVTKVDDVKLLQLTAEELRRIGPVTLKGPVSFLVMNKSSWQRNENVFHTNDYFSSSWGKHTTVDKVTASSLDFMRLYGMLTGQMTMGSSPSVAHHIGRAIVASLGDYSHKTPLSMLLRLLALRPDIAMVMPRVQKINEYTRHSYGVTSMGPLLHRIGRILTHIYIMDPAALTIPRIKVPVQPAPVTSYALPHAPPARHWLAAKATDASCTRRHFTLAIADDPALNAAAATLGIATPLTDIFSADLAQAWVQPLHSLALDRFLVSCSREDQGLAALSGALSLPVQGHPLLQSEQAKAFFARLRAEVEAHASAENTATHLVLRCLDPSTAYLITHDAQAGKMTAQASLRQLASLRVQLAELRDRDMQLTQTALTIARQLANLVPEPRVDASLGTIPTAVKYQTADDEEAMEAKNENVSQMIASLTGATVLLRRKVIDTSKEAEPIATISSLVATLSQALLALPPAERAGMYNSLTFLLRREAGTEHTISDTHILATLLSSRAVFDLRKLNPFLPPNLAVATLALAEAAVLRASRASHAIRALSLLDVLCDNLIQVAGPASLATSAAAATSSLLEQSRSLATHLSAHRHHVHTLTAAEVASVREVLTKEAQLPVSRLPEDMSAAAITGVSGSRAAVPTAMDSVVVATVAKASGKAAAAQEAERLTSLWCYPPTCPLTQPAEHAAQVSEAAARLHIAEATDRDQEVRTEGPASVWEIEALPCRFTPMLDRAALAGHFGVSPLTRAGTPMPGDGATATLAYDPRCLLLEFSRGIVLRQEQMSMVRSFSATLTGGSARVQQLLMGAGKTTVVAPLLATMLADGVRLVMLVVPPALLEFTRAVLRATYTGPMHKAIHTFTFNRSSDATPDMLAALYRSAAQRAVVLATPTSVKSVMVRLLELQSTLADPRAHRPADIERQISILSDMLQLFRAGCMLLDEVDLVLHPLKSELNFPIGPRHDLSFAPHRWGLAMHMLHPVFYHSRGEVPAVFADSGRAITTLARISAALHEGTRLSHIQLFPHLALLSPAFYDATLRPLFAEWATLWLHTFGLRGVPHDAVLTFLSTPAQACPAEVTAALTAASLSEQLIQALHLARNWVCSYAPHVLSKLNRIAYGLMTNQDLARALTMDPFMPASRSALAVPFVAKDCPSRASEFAHPDILLGFTCLAYRYEGLRYRDFLAIVDAMHLSASKEIGPHAQRPTVRLYESWVRAAGGVIRGAPAMVVPSASSPLVADTPAADAPQVAPFQFLQQASHAEMDRAYTLLRTSGPAVEWYLQNIVFPEHMRQQVEKLAASGADMPNICSAIAGFSGTPSDVLPLPLGKCHYQLGADGKVLHALTSPSVARPVALSSKWTVLELLRTIATATVDTDSAGAGVPKYRALIDSGALITGLTNEEVAGALLEHGLEWAEGVVFADEQGALMVKARAQTAPVPLALSGVPEAKRFVFYDQAHSSGVDVSHLADACAALTIGKDMSWRDYAQAAYRMRGLGRGQCVHVFVPVEIQALVARAVTAGALQQSEEVVVQEEMKRLAAGYVHNASDDAVATTLCALAGWLSLNGCIAERTQYAQLRLQNAAQAWRKPVLDELLARADLFTEERFPLDADTQNDRDTREQQAHKAAFDRMVLEARKKTKLEDRRKISARWKAVEACRHHRFKAKERWQRVLTTYRELRYGMVVRLLREMHAANNAVVQSYLSYLLPGGDDADGAKTTAMRVLDNLADAPAVEQVREVVAAARAKLPSPDILRAAVQRFVEPTGNPLPHTILVDANTVALTAIDADASDIDAALLISATLDAEVVQEMEEERLRELEIEEEKEVELERCAALAYRRDEEEPEPWPVSLLTEHEVDAAAAEGCVVPATVHHSIYPAALLEVGDSGRLPLPAHIHVTRNYYAREWRGARRLKNVSMIMEWSPSVSLAQVVAPPQHESVLGVQNMAQLALTHKRQATLARDAIPIVSAHAAVATPGHTSPLLLHVASVLMHAVTGLAVTPEQALELLATTNVPADAPVSSVAVEALFAAVGACLGAGMRGRHWAVVSLAEAATLRKLVHSSERDYYALPQGVSLAVRCVAHGRGFADVSSQHLPSTAAYVAQQVAWCHWFNGDAQLTNAHAAHVLALLEKASPVSRNTFLALTHACRRRARSQDYVPPALRCTLLLQHRVELAVRAALAQALRMALQRQGWSPRDALAALDFDKDGRLSAADVLALTKALGLADVAAEDVVALVISHADRSGSLSHDAFVGVLSIGDEAEAENGAIAVPAIVAPTSPVAIDAALDMVTAASTATTREVELVTLVGERLQARVDSLAAVAALERGGNGGVKKQHVKEKEEVTYNQWGWRVWPAEAKAQLGGYIDVAVTDFTHGLEGTGYTAVGDTALMQEGEGQQYLRVGAYSSIVAPPLNITSTKGCVAMMVRIDIPSSRTTAVAADANEARLRVAGRKKRGENRFNYRVRGNSTHPRVKDAQLVMLKANETLQSYRDVARRAYHLYCSPMRAEWHRVGAMEKERLVWRDEWEEVATPASDEEMQAAVEALTTFTQHGCLRSGYTPEWVLDLDAVEVALVMRAWREYQLCLQETKTAMERLSGIRAVADTPLVGKNVDTRLFPPGDRRFLFGNNGPDDNPLGAQLGAQTSVVCGGQKINNSYLPSSDCYPVGLDMWTPIVLSWDGSYCDVLFGEYAHTQLPTQCIDWTKPLSFFGATPLNLCATHVDVKYIARSAGKFPVRAASRLMQSLVASDAWVCPACARANVDFNLSGGACGYCRWQHVSVCVYRGERVCVTCMRIGKTEEKEPVCNMCDGEFTCGEALEQWREEQQAAVQARVYAHRREKGISARDLIRQVPADEKHNIIVEQVCPVPAKDADETVADDNNETLDAMVVYLRDLLRRSRSETLYRARTQFATQKKQRLEGEDKEVSLLRWLERYGVRPVVACPAGISDSTTMLHGADVEAGVEAEEDEDDEDWEMYEDDEMYLDEDEDMEMYGDEDMEEDGEE